MADTDLNSPSSPPRRAWVTLLTRTSYLPGAVLLAHSLQTQKSAFPLLILTTPSFPSSLLSNLEKECSLTNSKHLAIEPLHPPEHNKPATLIAARFEDTWTKLRVFELHKHGYEKLIFLDADMLVRRNMDELFDMGLPRDWIAANHACVCNLDNDSWAPEDWTAENCAYTPLKKDSGPAPVPKPGAGDAKRTHELLNGGLFVFSPHQEQWESMLEYLDKDPKIKEFMFPDQDFLAEYFKGRWKSVKWQYNALKTMRYWHKNMWEDAEVRNLHYIVDKPWSKRIGSDGVAGYLGRDGETHAWWWKEYESWEKERQKLGEMEILEMVRQEVAEPSGDGGNAEALHGNWQAS